MGAGKLRNLAKVQVRTEAKDDFGNPLAEPTWLTVVELTVSIEPMSTSTDLIAREPNSNLTHKLKARYTRETILPNYRMVIQERIFHIEHVVNVNELNRELNFLCIERVI